MINVVVGIIQRDGRYFLQQRLDSGECPLQWEFPGGKVEPGESQVQALYRELEEELWLSCTLKQLKVSPVPCFVCFLGNDVLRSPTSIYFYDVVLEDDVEPLATEAIGSGWFNKEEAKRLTLTPGSLEFLNAGLK